MSAIEANIRVLDAAYKPFPAFSEWRSLTFLDTVRWERYRSSLRDRAGLSEELLNRAREIAKRAAALETGAIENLYEVDRGFTYTVAFETAAWEAALAQKGERVRSLFEAQLQAYDYVLDLATKAEPISEAAIRALHEVVCAAQPTYRVMTAIGPQEQPFPKGQYKTLPNHVRTRKGIDHSYGPVDVTPAEMARLVHEIRSEEFLAAHPVTQASYTHYAFVAIHPFADGNGRVARALASAFTYRAISMPIVILAEHKNAYLDSLEKADQGEYQAFVDFMLARSLDTLKLVDESIRSASSPNLEQTIAAINGLYVTKGGYTQDQVDKAGADILNGIQIEIQAQIAKIGTPKISFNVTAYSQSGMVSPPSGYRYLIGGGLILRIVVSSAPPAGATVQREYVVLLPRDAAGDDDILFQSTTSPDTLIARIDEAVPSLSGVLQIRLRMFAERVLAEMLENLQTLAQAELRFRH